MLGIMFMQAESHPLPALVVALLPPMLVCLMLLAWAARLKRLGRFAGEPGTLHAWAARLRSIRAREMALDISALGSSTLVTLLAPVLMLGFWQGGYRGAALVIGGSTALASALGSALKRLTGRVRPGAATTAYFGSSFPSSHTLMGSTLYGSAAAQFLLHEGLTPCTALAALGALLIALLIGCTRVLLRVHYLSDVIAGWLLAAALITSGVLLSA
jgi:membrane-associated phospholipid phosphatase